MRGAGPQILCAALVVFTAAVAVAAHDPITTRVTWTGEISRIVQARCVTCHSPDGRGPMSLMTYDDARPWARAIKEEVMTRRMPKWHAVRGYGDFRNDPSLSAFEIALIAAWADGGAPRGTEAGDRARPQHGREATASQSSPLAARAVTVPCRDQPAPAGTLVAIRPELEKDGAVGISVTLPDGRREIVAWIRGFEPEFATAYALRVPIVLPPTSVLNVAPAQSGCTITLTFMAQ